MVTASRLERRDREKLARRNDILRAAREIFATRGYRDATLDEIAQRAAFAKGTLYNYFQSKEQIFDQILDSVLAEVIALSADALRGGDSLREKLRRHARALIMYFKANEDFLKIVAREMNRMLFDNQRAEVEQIRARVMRIHAALKRVLEVEMKHHRVRNVNPDVLAHLFSEMIHIRTIRCLFVPKGMESLDPEKEAEFLVDLFLDGVAVHSAG